MKKNDGTIETITLMPHNLVFGLTLEMTALGGSRTLLRGPGATGWAVYTKNTIKIGFWFNSKGQHQNA